MEQHNFDYVANNFYSSPKELLSAGCEKIWHGLANSSSRALSFIRRTQSYAVLENLYFTAKEDRKTNKQYKENGTMKQENNAGTGSLHKAGTIIGAVLCVILSVMLIGNLTIIVKGTINPNTPPSMFGIYPLAVMSGSMSGDAPDHIEVGDLIFTKGVKPEEVKVNDVISFMENKSVVTHRVMEIRTNEDGTLSYVTKGDANNSEDAFPTPGSRLLGVYKGRIPKVGDFALFLQQPLGMLIFIGIPLFAFIIYDIIRRQRLSRKENKKNNEMEAELERLRKLAGEDKSPNSSENDEANA